MVSVGINLFKMSQAAAANGAVISSSPDRIESQGNIL